MALSKIQAESMNLADTYAFTGTVSGAGAYESQLFHLQHIEASSVDGGSSTTGAYNTRVLNSTVKNQISGASVSSNIFTLPVGTYLIYGNARAFKANRHFLAIEQQSPNTIVEVGQSSYANDQVTETSAVIWCTLTVSGSSTGYKLLHYTENGRVNDGLGIASNKTTNHHVDLLIWKIA